MASNLHSLPPLKRFRLLHQEKQQQESDLPTKKRKQSREKTPITVPPTPPTTICLPAKKRIWAIRPESPPSSSFDLNIEYTQSPEKQEDDDGIRCAVCESTDGDPKDPIVFCDGCELTVHASCYGNPLVNEIPEGDWFCAQCSLPGEKRCCLCPAIGGALKPTTTRDGKWAHITCAVLVPEVFFHDPEGRDGIDCSKVPEKRWREICYVCEGRDGCVVECSQLKCPLGFHVSCGLKEDLCIELREGRFSGGIVAAFCKQHTEIWKKEEQTGKFKIVAREEPMN